MIKFRENNFVVSPFIFFVGMTSTLTLAIVLIAAIFIDGPTSSLERSIEQIKFCEKHGMTLELREYHSPRCVKKE